MHDAKLWEVDAGMCMHLGIPTVLLHSIQMLLWRISRGTIDRLSGQPSTKRSSLFANRVGCCSRQSKALESSPNGASLRAHTANSIVSTAAFPRAPLTRCMHQTN